ncbi:hypothetical protein [Actinomadura sp. DC4]|uniref:hypothetical protein n=1 Tax=Actinomadura sp. DC4 TaxID=3055069 RepID=UPI0025AEF0E1|nr:hypothetical protein [Actinomadura sp. DC4]MDN3351935.1 hypothetical protein [Actinomadura sp. DC4]
MAAHAGPLRFGRWRHEKRGLGAVLGRAIWLIAVVAALVLVTGVALTWTHADPGNDIVHGLTSAGGRLATPFRHVFGDADARERLTENHLLAAGVYLAGGGILSWLLER